MVLGVKDTSSVSRLREGGDGGGGGRPVVVTHHLLSCLLAREEVVRTTPTPTKWQAGRVEE